MIFKISSLTFSSFPGKEKEKSEIVKENNEYDALARLPDLARETGQIYFLGGRVYLNSLNRIKPPV